MPFQSNYLKNVALRIDGNIYASKNVSQWPKYENSTKYKNFMQIEFADNFTVLGNGKIDGRGYHWWILTLLSGRNKYLPHSG